MKGKRDGKLFQNKKQTVPCLKTTNPLIDNFIASVQAPAPSNWAFDC